MSGTYLERVKAQTSTRFWVNNPTLADVSDALAQGAVGCTTNPAFMGGLLRRAPDEIRPLIEARVQGGGDDHAIADRVQLDLVGRIARQFRPVHDDNQGRLGFVSIQGGPATDQDPAAILQEALAARAESPNVIPKLPATAPGLEAMEGLVAAGHPCIVTEVFSLAQLIAVCERHRVSTAALDRVPPLFISPITGIFGDHLRSVAAEAEWDVPTEAILAAGVILSRACQRMVDERGYAATLLAGGARTPTDFTDLVGGGMHVTINYSTAEELIALDPPVVERVHDHSDDGIVAALERTFEDVRLALDPGALAPGDFERFPPVLYFRNLFSAGWEATLAAIQLARGPAPIVAAAAAADVDRA